MDPRDALPHAHRAVGLDIQVDVRCGELHNQARQPTVDRRKYCQLTRSSTDDGLVYHSERKASAVDLSCDDDDSVMLYVSVTTGCGG